MQPPGRSTRAGTGCAGVEAGGSPREDAAGRGQAWWSLDFTLNQSKVLRVLLKLGIATRFDLTFLRDLLAGCGGWVWGVAAG